MRSSLESVQKNIVRLKLLFAIDRNIVSDTFVVTVLPQMLKSSTKPRTAIGVPLQMSATLPMLGMSTLPMATPTTTISPIATMFVV
jgi:hypothetical protein